MLRFIGKTLLFLVIVCVAFQFVGLIQSNIALKNDVIRLHVIANSDSEEDQAVKMKVRDGVLSYIEQEIKNLTNREQVEHLLSTKLNEIEEVANRILKENGSAHIAKVKLGLEEFGKRIYDTFSLPSGVYKALQIEIGEAEGQNWWCVVFPALCVPSTNSEFCEVAASAGFDHEFIETISNEGNYKIRFFILDLFGKIENFLFLR